MVQPLLVEAPGQIVPNVWISYPITGQEAVRRTVFGVSITDTGHGSVGMAKIFEYSSTAVSKGGAKKENDTLCTKMVSWQDISV